MQISKFIHNSIFDINKDELEGLIEKRDLELKFTCEERQLFIYEHIEKDSKGYSIVIYTAIDNTCGEMFMEDFRYEDDAIIWLLDLKCSEQLQKAEEQDWWW